MDGKKKTQAQMRATQKYESKAYFKFLTRFKKEDEDAIRQAAGDSVNAFIVGAVMDAVRKSQNAPESQNAPADGVKWFAFPADMIAEMQKYGDPAEMLFDGAMAMISEYEAGLR